MADPIPSPWQKETNFGQDVGHDALIYDLQELVREADQYAFHDYKNSKYPFPKATLIAKMETILQRVKGGYYDNKNVV